MQETGKYFGSSTALISDGKMTILRHSNAQQSFIFRTAAILKMLSQGKWISTQDTELP